jgi:hypothetical protein
MAHTSCVLRCATHEHKPMWNRRAPNPLVPKTGKSDRRWAVLLNVSVQFTEL